MSHDDRLQLSVPQPRRGSEELLRRLRALEALSDVSTRVAGSLDLDLTLRHISDAVVDSLGFGVAVLNVVEGDDLVARAVAGPPDVHDQLSGTRQDVDSWLRVLARATPLGRLFFVDGRTDDDDLEGMAVWVPDTEVPDDPDGWHPLDALFAPLRDDDGELTGVLSVDLPADGKRPDAATVEMLERFAVQAALAIERARLHRDLEDSAELFRLTFEDAPLGMALLDDVGRLVQANATYARLVGAEVAELPGRVAVDLVHDDDRTTVATALQELVDGAARSVSGLVRRHDGGMWGRVVASRIHSRQGLRVLVQLEDVTEQVDAEQRLRQEATTDSLTGLANRAAVLARLDALVGRADADVAVLFCDVDRFKEVNDRHGHAAGDRLLTGVARALRAALRDGDVAGRVGGDEVVVLLAGPDGERTAVAVADRVLAAVDALAEEHDLPVRPSLSIGIAVARGGTTTGDALLARADAALYRAKEQGRGRWVLAAQD